MLTSEEREGKRKGGNYGLEKRLEAWCREEMELTLFMGRAERIIEEEKVFVVRWIAYRNVKRQIQILCV